MREKIEDWISEHAEAIEKVGASVGTGVFVTVMGLAAVSMVVCLGYLFIVMPFQLAPWGATCFWALVAIATIVAYKTNLWEKF